MFLFNRFNKNNLSLEQLMQEDYQEQYFSICKSIWHNYVPKRGQATCLQGELLRGVEKIRDEAQRNGNINWDDRFDDLVDYLKVLFAQQKCLTHFEQQQIKLILSHFKACGHYSCAYRKGEITDNDFRIEQMAVVDDNLYDRLTDYVAQINLANDSQPIAYQPNNQLQL